MNAALLATLLAASSALARLQGADGGDILLSGVSSLHGVIRAHRTEFLGSPVKMERGDATLTCKKLVAQQDDKDVFQTATCEGDVRFVRGDRVVTCEKATYDDPKALLTCEGSPEIHIGKSVFRGSVLVYDVGKDEFYGEKITGEVDSAIVDGAVKKKGARAEPQPKAKEPTP